MKLSPVRSFREPRYPTAAILSLHPELLRVIPRRWHGRTVVLGALAGVLALMEQSTAKAGDNAALEVAPVFLHGNGTGAYGCVAVSPPVYFSEDEAREIIQEEAKKLGVEFHPGGPVLKGVDLPVTDEFSFTRKNKEEQKTKKGDFSFDGWNDPLKVGYQFVSREDFRKWESKDKTVWASVSAYDIQGTAKRLQNGLKGLKKSDRDGYVAVFYDPMTSTSDSRIIRPNKSDKVAKTVAEELAQWKESEKAAKKVAAEDLRSQVKDFVAWLKAQGVI